MKLLQRKAPFCINLKDATKEEIIRVFKLLVSKGASGVTSFGTLLTSIGDGYNYLHVEDSLGLSCRRKSYLDPINPYELDIFLGENNTSFYMDSYYYSKKDMVDILSLVSTTGNNKGGDPAYPVVDYDSVQNFHYFGVNVDNETHCSNHVESFGEGAVIWDYQKFASVYGDVLGRNAHDHRDYWFVNIDSNDAKEEAENMEKDFGSLPVDSEDDTLEDTTNNMMSLAEKYNVAFIIKGDKIYVTPQNDNDYEVANGAELKDLLSALSVTDKYLSL